MVFGVFDAEGKLVAMTFVDVNGDRAEVDFTVAREIDAAKDWRLLSRPCPCWCCPDSV